MAISNFFAAVFTDRVVNGVRDVKSVLVVCVVRWGKEGLSTLFSKREVRMERAQYLMMEDTKLASVDESIAKREVRRERAQYLILKDTNRASVDELM